MLQTKVDFGMCVGVLLVISIVCLLFGASAVMAPSETGRFAFAAFGVRGCGVARDAVLLCALLRCAAP